MSFECQLVEFDDKKNCSEKQFSAGISSVEGQCAPQLKNLGWYPGCTYLLYGVKFMICDFLDKLAE